MSVLTVDKDQLKDVVRGLVVEVLEERPALLNDLVEEALLDIGLERAIQEGEQTSEVSIDEVHKILDGE